MSSRRENDRKGNAAYVAMTILALLGFGALTVDIGNARMVKAQLQVACDFGVHAGVAQLDGTSDGLSNAKSMAKNVANANTVMGASPNVGDGDIQLGIYDLTTHTFTPATSPVASVNAMRITKQITSVPAYFSLAAFHVSSLTAGASSTAVHAAASATDASCFLPLAIPDCRFLSGMSQHDIQNLTFQFTPATGDSIGWALPGTSNPSADSVRDQVVAEDYCGSTPASTVVSLSNGMITSALSALSTQMQDSDTTWDESRWGTLPGRTKNSDGTYSYDSTQLLTGSDWVSGSSVSSHYGRVIEGPIVLFHSPSSANYCSDANGDGVPDGGGYTEDGLTISGIAWAVIYDIANSGSNKNLRMKLDFTQEHQLTGSHGSFGGYDTNANGYVTVIQP